MILFAMEFTRALWKDSLPVHRAGDFMPDAQDATEPWHLREGHDKWTSFVYVT